MGLFSGKKTIVVSSTVYNMAGEEADRPNFLKNSVFGAVMSDYDHYLGNVIVSNYLRGPGINQRNFFKWAERNSYPGLPTYSALRELTVDSAVVAPFIPTPGTPADLVLAMQSASSISGDYEHIVEAYVLENYPNNYNTDYVSSYDLSANEITIQWEVSGSVTFSAGSYTPAKEYIVADYFHYLAASVGDLNTGSTTVGALSKPSTSGYGLDGSSNRGVTRYNMTYDERVVTVYTGVPTLPADTDVTTPESDYVDFDGLDETWSKITYEGGSGDDEAVVNREHFLEIYEYRDVYTHNAIVSVVVNENTPAAGQTETITTWRDGDWSRPIYDWRIDTQDTIVQETIGGVQMFTYERGTGESTLDDLFEDASTTALQAEYFPFMPIRLNNVSITDAIYDDITGSGLYEKTNRAYRRASGGGQRFSKLVDEVEDNADIDDIDYAFTHHGVAINVIEPACRAYMYDWLKGVSVHQTTNSSYMSGYASAVSTYVAEVTAMNAWVYAQGDSGRSGYGDAMPTRPKLDSISTTTVRLNCEDTQLTNLDMRVSWVNISESLHSGAPTNPDTSVAAVEGDIWMQAGTDLTWDVPTGQHPNILLKTFNVEKLEMYWQTGSNAYKKLTIWGLVHRNYVYGGEEVKTMGQEGLADTDPSGFIIPLHYPTMKNLGIVDATQMATANTHIVFNCYEIVKQKWYEGFLGMLIIIIVVVVLSVIFAPAGAAAGGGLLGGNAAVGAAMGLSGTAAIVAGAIANAVVAIIVAKIVTAGSTALFGDKWGAIVGAVINLAITMGASGAFSTESFGELMTAGNILKITSAIANGYNGYVQGSIAEMGDELEKKGEKYEDRMDEINKLIADLSGNDLNFNPLYLTDSVKGNDTGEDTTGQYVTETLDQFIHRTTMTGSDIVDVTLSLVNNHADLSLELPS